MYWDKALGVKSLPVVVFGLVVRGVGVVAYHTIELTVGP
jgi:hypothetical protein